MRLLVVAEQLRRPVEGGIGTYVRGLVRGLSTLDVDLTLYASRPPRSGPDPVAALGPAVATSPLPAPALVRAWDRGLGRLPGGYDVVHATSFAMPPATPLSVMVHDLAWRHFPDAFPDRGRRWHEAALGRALDRARLLVVPSATVADDLVAAGAPAAQVEVVEEGSDHLAPADDAGAGALLTGLGIAGDYLLTVSTLEPRKNLPRLLAAYDAARGQLPPLVVVGPVGWGPDLRPGPGVVLAGLVTGGTLTALYRRAHLLVYVPLREGFGLPAVEAMACGTPVVAGHVPGAGDAAARVDPFDVDAIAGALVRVATDEGLRADLVGRGRARAAALTWEQAARRHVELWAALR